MYIYVTYIFGIYIALYVKYMYTSIILSLSCDTSVNILMCMHINDPYYVYYM